MRIVSGREIISFKVSDGTAVCEITDQHGQEVHREETGVQALSDVERLVERCAAIVASLRQQREVDASYAAAAPARQKLWAGIWPWWARRIRRWLT